MIKSFRDKDTQRVFERQRVPGLSPELDAAETLNDVRSHPETGSRSLRGTAPDNTASVSTTNGGSVFSGATVTRMRLRLRITTRRS